MTTVTTEQLQRAAELLMRAARGADDPAYCLRWAERHIEMAQAIERLPT